VIKGVEVGDRVQLIGRPKQSGEVREVKPGAVFVRLGDYPEDDPCWVELEHLEVIGVAEEVPESFRAALYLIEDLKKERDLWRLRCEWQEAIVAAIAAERKWLTAKEQHSYTPCFEECVGVAEKRRDAAKAAYVAAGGVV
jgi:hypothetical protein